MQALVEIHQLAVGEDTTYRVRPNPDVECGYKGGAVLEWRGNDGGGWNGYMHISPDCLRALSGFFARAADEAEGDGGEG